MDSDRIDQRRPAPHHRRFLQRSRVPDAGPTRVDDASAPGVVGRTVPGRAI